MQKRHKPTSWFTWIFACGVVVSIGWVALSFLDHLFYVMGPPPGDAARAAFRSDLKIAPLILGGFAILGQAATLFAAETTRPSNSETAYWSEQYRSEVRRRR